MTESSAKKDVQKLQRSVVDALEDVKAQDLRVFDTEHLSSLFERVIIASGTSNRQTKALAASVRDKVREAGFPKPRIEGEDNGEWIIVDCGSVVAHIMQPNIRQYYNLEEIWGEKPVRLKFGAPKPASPEPKDAPVKKAASKKAAAKTSAKPAGKTAARPTTKSTAKSASTASSKAPAKRASATTSATKTAKPIVKVVVGKPAAKPATKAGSKTGVKPAAKKAPAKKTAARRKA